MTRQIARLMRWLRHRSREGMVGLGLVVICTLFYLSSIRPTEMRVIAAEEAQHMANMRNRTHNDPATFHTLAQAQLSTFYAYFPQQNSTPDWLDKIYADARKANVELIDGDYRERRASEGRLLGYQIRLPAKGSYIQLRHFITSVLTDIPVASLDHVSFERDKIADSVITAKISLTIYMDRHE